MRIVYWEPARMEPAGMQSTGSREAAPTPFRQGRAGSVWYNESGQLQTDTRVVLSVNSTHALLGHGVVEALNALPLQGHLGTGLQVMIPAPVCEDARRLLYEADRQTYGAQHEFVVAREVSEAEPVEYRVRIDNREYQRTLSRLQFLTSSAPREGKGVWLEI